MTLRALLFDFDMTLMDTMGALHASALKMQEHFGKPLCTLDFMYRIIGLNSRDYWLQLMGDERPEYRQFYMEACAPFEYDRMIPAEGAFELLKTLRERGLKVGCASNRIGPMRAIGPKGLAPFLDCVAGADSVPRPKPAPDVLLKGCGLLGVLPEETLYVGDTPIDVQAARAAGMNCAALLTSNSREALEKAGPWRVIPALKDLLPLLEREGLIPKQGATIKTQKIQKNQSC